MTLSSMPNDTSSSSIATPLGAAGGSIHRFSPLMRAMLALSGRLSVGRLTIRFPDGSSRVIAGSEPGPEAVLEIQRNRLARRFLFGGNLGFCEAYLDGDWTSPDVAALFTYFLRNEAGIEQAMNGPAWSRGLQRLLHRLRPNNRRGARRNIARHYDLGNAFYGAWLDPSLTYSAAVFAGPDEDLAAAQRRKYALLAQRLDLRPGHRLLEIGCGWGGFARFAATEIGAAVTAVTISREQFDLVRKDIFENGLSGKIEVRLQDYRDIGGSFDRIASIEMLEAVGEAYWPVFFDRLRQRLVPGGRAALQVITIDDRLFDTYRAGADYIQKYIFPGGMLPSPSALRHQVAAAGLRLLEIEGYGPHYARTLRLWNDRFQAAWPAIEAMGFDTRFKRMWEQYLAYCAAGFDVGTIDLQQFSLARD
jgi:cyclopropane-fatty-acyl-phospholipid synthase